MKRIFYAFWKNQRYYTTLPPKTETHLQLQSGKGGSGMLGYGLDRSGSAWEQVAGPCESGNEPLGSIRCREFIDQLETG